MKKIFYIIIFISLTFISSGQTFAWVRNSAGPNSQPKMTSVCADHNGNSVIAGSFYQGNISFGTFTLTNSGDYPIFLVKYDSNGNVLWAKKFSGSTSFANLCNSVTVDGMNNIIITGAYLGPTIVFGTYTLTNTGGSNVFVVKFDPNGNVIWANSSTGPNDNRGQDVSVDNSNNIVVTGFFTSSTVTFGSQTLSNPIGTGIQIAYVVKYDPNGNALWAKRSSGNSQGNSVKAGPSGDVFITGYFDQLSIAFNSYTLISQPNSTYNMFLVKYNSAGTEQWAKCATGDSLRCVSNAVCTDVSGNVLITGWYTSDTIKFGTQTLANVSAGEADIFVTKYDSNGNVLWAKSGGENGDDIGFSIASYNNEFIVGGTFDALPLAFSTHTIYPPPGNVDPTFIAKFDQNGNVNCSYAFDTDAEDDRNDVSIDDEGNIYFTSRFFDTTLTVGTNTLNVTGWPNIFLTKYNCSFVGVTEFKNNIRPVLVYPNPNNGSFKLQIDNEIENGEIILINLLGQTVHRQKISQGENNIITTDLAKGLYNYIILRDKGQISNGKLTLE